MAFLSSYPSRQRTLLNSVSGNPDSTSTPSCCPSRPGKSGWPPKLTIQDTNLGFQKLLFLDNDSNIRYIRVITDRLIGISLETPFFFFLIFDIERRLQFFFLDQRKNGLYSSVIGKWLDRKSHLKSVTDVFSCRKNVLSSVRVATPVGGSTEWTRGGKERRHRHSSHPYTSQSVRSDGSSDNYSVRARDGIETVSELEILLSVLSPPFPQNFCERIQLCTK